MIKQCIQKTKSHLDYQRVFPDISSLVNKWNMSYDESDEEELISKNLTLYSENIFLSYPTCEIKGGTYQY